MESETNVSREALVAVEVSQTPDIPLFSVVPLQELLTLILRKT